MVPGNVPDEFKHFRIDGLAFAIGAQGALQTVAATEIAVGAEHYENGMDSICLLYTSRCV